MGYAGDVLGRNAAMVLTLSLVVLGAFLSSAAPYGTPTAVYIVIIIARFILGIGAGGVYPLSATKAAEDSGHGGGSVDVRAASWAFFWQQPGAMTPWLFALLFTCIPNMSNDTMWRLLLGLGAVPSFIVVIMSIYEIRLKSQIKQLQQSVGDGNSSNSIDGGVTRQDDVVLRELLSQWSTWRDLIATGGGWFIYDVAYCEYLIIYLTYINEIINKLYFFRTRWCESVWWRDSKQNL
jgi:MFS transporter, PHS family, inorganic phosphate transporter